MEVSEIQEVDIVEVPYDAVNVRFDMVLIEYCCELEIRIDGDTSTPPKDDPTIRMETWPTVGLFAGPARTMIGLSKEWASLIVPARIPNVVEMRRLAPDPRATLARILVVDIHLVISHEVPANTVRWVKSEAPIADPKMLTRELFL